MSFPTADAVIKDYFDVPDHFADFINGTVFKGSQILSPDDILPHDKEASTVVQVKDQFEAIRGIRDVTVKTSQKGIFVIIGLENQSTEDKNMAVRQFIYTAAEYNKQYRKYDHDYRERLKEEKEEALKKGVKKKKHSRDPFVLMPVMTPVFYYGKKLWVDEMSLLDHTDLLESYKENISDWKIKIYDIKKLEISKFQNKDNKALIETVQMIYKYKDHRERLKGIKIDTEVALVVAAITNEANYLQQAKAIEEMEKRKERVDMYEMMEILYSESYSKGMTEGRIEGEIKGIIKTVLSLVKKKLGTISEEVREKIENSSQEKLEELTNDIFEIESEEDVMKVLR